MKKSISKLIITAGLMFGAAPVFSLSGEAANVSTANSVNAESKSDSGTFARADQAKLPRSLVSLLQSNSQSGNGNTDRNADQAAPWAALPPTPTLPATEESGYADINKIKIWYAAYGDPSNEPVVLIHESYGNANYWGELVPELSDRYRVIVLDTRGNGRSSINNEPLSIHLMASDVLGLMDYLNINKAAIIGWGDGANMGVDLAINHPDRISKLFAFGGNSSPASDVASVYQSNGFLTFVARGQQEYLALSPTPTAEGYNSLSKRLSAMWGEVPNFSKTQLENIPVPTWIADGDRDGAISFDSDTVYMSQTIPNAGLLIEPNMNHFGVIQNSKLFNANVKFFLEYGYVQAEK